MFVDVANLADSGDLNADVCIVGAGAAGLALALEYCGSNTSVIVLESGQFKLDKAAQSLYAGHVVDEALHSPTDRYRQRQFGGSTSTWGGRCVPFDPIDFEARDYIPHSGWPFGMEALSPHYARANRICEAGEYAYRAADCRDPFPEMIAGFDAADVITEWVERFSCPTDFGKRYARRLELADNITVVLGANVTGIMLRANGIATDALRVQTLEGAQFLVRASVFVLAAGGLENARIMLASNDVHEHGVGNANDSVGRYYMCHLAGTMGEVTIDSDRHVHHGYVITNEGIYCRRRFSLPADVQREHRVGNFVARLHHPRITDPAHRNSILSLLYFGRWFIPYEYARRLFDPAPLRLADLSRHLMNVLSDPFMAVRFSWHLARDRGLSERKFPSVVIPSKANRFSLDFHAEQVPNPDSRVTLSADKDRLRMRRLSVDWRYTDEDIATVARSFSLLAKNLSSVGSLSYDPEAVELEMTRYGAFGGHHIGTTRMGSDPKTSVVDSDCRVHGVQNLYVAGSSVFPTSSQANPTLTIVALALRLADHLKNRLALDPAS